MDRTPEQQVKFSRSRQIAKQLVAGSIIEDAAAQFISLLMEEIHISKIKPLNTELTRLRTIIADLTETYPLTLSEAQARVDAARKMMRGL